MKPPALKRILNIIIVAVIYFIAARFSLLLALGHTNASPVWPPSGIAFALIIMLGFDVWPGIAIGAITANILVFYQNQAADSATILITSAIISIGNTLEALSGYYLLKLFNSSQIVNRARDFALFFITALLMCTVSCTIGATALVLNHVITWPNYVAVWFTWWMGDVSGVIVLTPILLSWKNIGRIEKIGTVKAIQIVLLFITLGIYLTAVFSGWLPIGLNKAKVFLIFFILIWCAFRMNQWQSSLVVLFLSAYTIWGTLNQQGPFIEGSQNTSFLSMQVFLCVASITMMFLSTTLQERRRIESNLIDVNSNLEIKVEERTAAIEKQKEELEATNEQLIKKTNELENAINDSRFFAHVISHDLREPLRTVTSFLELLDERYKNKLDSEADEYINFAVNGAKRMNSLIDDMLMYSRVEHSRENLQKVNFAEVLSVVKNNLRNTIQNHNAKIEIDGELPVISADFSQMTQLFQNLIDNAIKYGGNKPPEIHVAANKKNGNWLFSLTDNGIGIPKEYAERVFIMFQRLHTMDKYEGTGMGLAICKKIVEKHGGKIWVEPGIKEGSIFYFTLPGSRD